MTFWLGVLAICAIYFVAGIAATQLQQRLGLISIAHGLVLGSGAYVYAVVGTADHSPVVALAAAVGAGVVLGVATLFLAQRLVGDDFALITFALQIVWSTAVANTRPVLRGALGISDIPALPFLPGEGAAPTLWFCALTAAVLAAAFGLLWLTAFPQVCAVLARSRELAATQGLPTGSVRLVLGVLYGYALGVAGATLGAYLSFIEPGMFGTRLSVAVLAIAFAGVAAPRWGVAAGVALIVGVPQLLRFVDLPNPRVASLQILLAGLGVFLCACTFLRGRLVAGGEGGR